MLNNPCYKITVNHGFLFFYLFIQVLHTCLCLIAFNAFMLLDPFKVKVENFDNFDKKKLLHIDALKFCAI